MASQSCCCAGRILELTSEAVRNDNLGALDTIASGFAQSGLAWEDDLLFAALTLNSRVGQTLRDGVALFDNAHSNLLAGGSLSTTTVAAAMAAMRKQTSIDGAKLNLRARFLLVEPDDERAAREIVRDLSVPGEATLEVVVDAPEGQDPSR